MTGPTAGNYQAGGSLSFTVNCNAAVTVTGTPSLPLTIGSTARNASYASGSGTTALVFTYTVQAGDTDTDGIASASPLALNGGTIKDSGSTDAAWTFARPDTTAVLVNAPNTAPTLTAIPAQFVHAGTTLRVTAIATELDVPTQTLTFALVSGPMGAALNPGTGEFTWTPTDAQLGATTATVKVTDNGTPNLAATNTFAITVVGRPLIQPVKLLSGTATVVWTAIPGHNYLLQQNGTLGTLTWTNVGSTITATANTATNVDGSLGSVPRRFYRVVVP